MGLKPGNSKYLQFLDNFDKVVKPVCMDFDFVSFTSAWDNGGRKTRLAIIEALKLA